MVEFGWHHKNSGLKRKIIYLCLKFMLCLALSQHLASGETLFTTLNSRNKGGLTIKVMSFLYRYCANWLLIVSRTLHKTPTLWKFCRTTSASVTLLHRKSALPYPYYYRSLWWHAFGETACSVPTSSPLHHEIVA